MQSKHIRADYIVNHLLQFGKIQVSDLSRQFDVSETTIRKDLCALESSGVLSRVYGGAVLADSNRYQLSGITFPQSNKKAAIAKAVTDCIHDYQTVYLGAGTTCYKISKYLKSRKNLTVISNNINALLELCDFESFTVIGTGGRIRQLEKTLAFQGDFVNQFMKNVFIDVAILTCDGVTLKKGYTTHNRDEYYLYETIKTTADKIILAVDSDKFGRSSFLRMAEMSDVRHIVTDSGLPDEYRRFYNEKQYDLQIVDIQESLHEPESDSY